MIDIESLLAETTESPPCGPNLEYAPAFLELEQLSHGKEEQQFGATLIPAEAPRWPEVQEKAIALLRRSKDLRVACLLVRALLHTEGLAGLSPGLRLLHHLLEQYWDGVHPQLDANDNNDPTMRLNALAPLANPLVLQRELRNTPLVKSRQHGEVLVRDVEVALNKLPPRAGAAALPQAQIEAVLAAVAAEDSAAVPRPAEALAAAHALSALLDDKVGPARAPDLKPLMATLHALTQVIHDPAPESPDAEPRAMTGGDDAAFSPQGGPPSSGEVRSREDALLMIDKIIRYIESTEPTNPAPLLLKRGKRFMSMSFVDIVKEISPESIAKIDVIAGPQDAK